MVAPQAHYIVIRYFELRWQIFTVSGDKTLLSVLITSNRQTSVVTLFIHLCQVIHFAILIT